MIACLDGVVENQRARAWSAAVVDDAVGAAGFELELRRANDILRTASAFFAQAELDRKLKS